MEAVTETPVFFEAEPARRTSLNGVSPQEPQDWDGTELPTDVAAHPLLDEAVWVALRDSGRPSLDASDMLTSYQSRAEFLVGAWIIDKIVPPRLGGSLLGNLQPQMLRAVDVLAVEVLRNAVLMPRRSSKTTTIWCVLLGRCWMRPQHMTAYTMLTLAKKAEERFALDVRDPIRRKWRDVKTRPVKLMDGKGGKGIEFDNGSRLSILAPKGEDVRSGAYDTLVLDEAGEAEPEDWDDVVAAVIPSFDTRPGAQLILAGTGGKYRTGSYFWKTLHDETAGRLRYGVPDDIDADLLESWSAGAGRLIEDLHPGLDGLTTLDRIEANFPDLGATLFSREYLGHFGDEHGTSTLFSATGWQKGMQPGEPPEGITDAALALAIHPHGLWVSIAVAWHVTAPTDLATAAWELDGATVSDPHRGFKLVHHQRGVEGIEEILLSFARRLNAPIVYDHGASQTRAAIERLSARAYPRPEVTPYQFGDAKVAAAQLVAAIESGSVWHWAQAPIEKAAAIAVRRAVGQGFLIGLPKGDEGADVTPLDAVALALDALPDRPAQSLTPADAIQWND